MPSPYNLDGFNQYRRDYYARHKEKVIATNLLSSVRRVLSYGLQINERGEICKGDQIIDKAGLEEIIAADLASKGAAN